jgi:hypothetical protein
MMGCKFESLRFATPGLCCKEGPESGNREYRNAGGLQRTLFHRQDAIKTGLIHLHRVHIRLSSSNGSEHKKSHVGLFSGLEKFAFVAYEGELLW